MRFNVIIAKKHILKRIYLVKNIARTCLNWYISYIISNIDIRTEISNLDLCIKTTNNNCNKHEPRNLVFCTQEWCENCSEILYFKQIITNQNNWKFKVNIMDHFYKENCKLC